WRLAAVEGVGGNYKSMFHTRISVKCPAELSDMLVAELADAGFDAFIEIPDGFEGYADGEQYDAKAVEDIRHRYQSLTQDLTFNFDKVEKTNWNAVWESSYEPVVIDDTCLIRAAFHKPERNFPYEIIITPT